MSNCIKDLYDYDLIKKCSRCKNILLKSNFHKDNKRKDGVQRMCIICTKQYHNNRKERKNTLDKERRKTDLNFKIACNLRSRTYQAFKSQNVRKTNKTFDLLGCSHSFFKNWIIHQLYGNMTLENYGSVWQIDHCLAITSFNLLDENDMKKCFNWINLRPMYCSENISKGNKINNYLYLLQEVKAKYFLELNVQEGLDENIH